MGWYFSNQSRSELIAELIATQETERASVKVIAHTLRGNVLWSVAEMTAKVEGVHRDLAPDQSLRYIRCDLLERSGGQWGRVHAPVLLHVPAVLSGPRTGAVPTGVAMLQPLVYSKDSPGRSTGCWPITPSPRTSCTFSSASVMIQWRVSSCTVCSPRLLIVMW